MITPVYAYWLHPVALWALALAVFAQRQWEKSSTLGWHSRKAGSYGLAPCVPQPRRMMALTCLAPTNRQHQGAGGERVAQCWKPRCLPGWGELMGTHPPFSCITVVSLCPVPSLSLPAKVLAATALRLAGFLDLPYPVTP